MKSVIFCQAPALVSGTLSCYEHEVSANRDVIIVVRGAYNLYQFFNELKLKATVVYFEQLESFYHFYRIKQKVKSDIRRLGLTEEQDRIFFTDFRDDPSMGVYLSYLRKYPVTLILPAIATINGMDRTGLPWIRRIKELAISFLYGYSFRYNRIDHWSLDLNISKYHYNIVTYKDLSIFSKYKLAGNIAPRQYAVFFTEPYRNKFQTEADYDRLTRLIIDQIHALGLKVAIKGHPRIGCHPIALEMADYEIPNYIPAEFLDMSVFRFAIGFVSTSLCSAAEYIKTYTVLRLCEIIDTREKDYWVAYIETNQKNGNVIFLNDFNEIADSLKENRD